MDKQSTLKLVGTDLDDEDLQDLTRQLCMTLNRETEIEAALPETESAPGAKGDPITLGTIALAFISSKAAVELVGVMRTYFAREPSLEMEVTRADGTSVVLRAEHFDGDELQKAQGLLESLAGGGQ